MSFNNSIGAVDCPCFKCPDRSPDCHGFCSKYKEFEGENAKHREALRREIRKADWARNGRKSRY